MLSEGECVDGLQLIHERVGMALVQRPDNAQQLHRPLYPIATDDPEAVLPIDDL